MSDTSMYRRAAIVADETVARLQREGYSSEAAQKMVLEVIRSEADAVSKGDHGFDESHCIERLQQLPDLDLPVDRAI